MNFIANGSGCKSTFPMAFLIILDLEGLFLAVLIISSPHNVVDEEFALRVEMFALPFPVG